MRRRRLAAGVAAAVGSWRRPPPYGATTAPVLRLITCAGGFGRASGSYRDNLVVSATRVPDGKGVTR